MNPEELLRLLEDAQAALAGDPERKVEPVPMHVVNDYIRTNTNGAVNGFMSLQLAVPAEIRRASDNPSVRDRASDEQRDTDLVTFGTAGPLQHFAESALQGATLGGAKHFMGEGFKERLDARRTLNPGASLAAEAAGMLVPGAGTAKLMRSALAPAQGFLSSAGRAAGIAGAESAVVGGLEAEGGLVERAKGAGIGAAAGAVLGAAGPVVGRAARPFRTNRNLAAGEAREILEQTGRSAEEVFEEMRQLQSNPAFGSGRATLMDVDPSIGSRGPAITKLAPALRAAGGPLESLRTRVSPAAGAKMRKSIWGAFDGSIVNDPAILKWIRTNPNARSAANQVVRGDIGAKEFLRFEDVQDILRVMGRSAQRQNKGGIRTAADATMQSRMHLESMLDNAVPGFREANQVWADASSRFEGAEKLIAAIDKSLPTFSPDLPSRADGIISTVREALSNTKQRRAIIARMVGEAIMAGEEDVMEDLVKRGFFSQLFRGTVTGTPGGAALGVPGLLTVDRE
jgi:hypothetical protein